MSYDAQLSEANFAHFQPNGEVMRYLEQTRQRLGLEKSAMNVLDWGSGRGEYVAHMRDAGFNAFGAEIRKEAAERGKDLIVAHGHDYERVIRPIASDCRTDLPAGFFHFVFSHYVIEHVADLDAVTSEIARVTAPDGAGFHVYPGNRKPIEPHLFMPFIHWLPKSEARKWAIRGCVACGIEPKWDWLEGASAQKKTQAYFDFCMDETFYRPFGEVRGSFEQRGFAVIPVSAEHPALKRLDVIPSALRNSLVEMPLHTFQTVEIVVHKAQNTTAAH